MNFSEEQIRRAKDIAGRKATAVYMQSINEELLAMAKTLEKERPHFAEIEGTHVSTALVFNETNGNTALLHALFKVITDPAEIDDALKKAKKIRPRDRDLRARSIRIQRHTTMTIEIFKGRYFAALMYCEVDVGKEGNIMGAIYRDKGERALNLLYRIRWYRDERLDDQSKDEKKWWHMRKEPEPGESDEDFEKDAVSKLRLAITLICRVAGAPNAKPEFITPRSDDPDVVINLVALQNWAHFSIESLFPGPEFRGRA